MGFLVAGGYAAGASGSFLVGLLFLTLKLTGHIGWSWWWVTAPFWLPSVLVALILAVTAVVVVARERAHR